MTEACLPRALIAIVALTCAGALAASARESRFDVETFESAPALQGSVLNL